MKIILFLSFIILSSCVNFTTFDKEKPIEIENTWLGTRHTQDGKPIELLSLIEGLEKHPASAESMKNASTLFYTSMALAVTGGFMWGYYAPRTTSKAGGGTTTSGDQNLSNAGIGLAIVGIGLGAYVDTLVAAGVEKFNQSQGKKVSWIPLINFNLQQNTPIIGIQKTF